MDDYGDVKEAYVALLEHIILNAGLKLPGVYEGLYGKDGMRHRQRVREVRDRHESRAETK